MSSTTEVAALFERVYPSRKKTFPQVFNGVLQTPLIDQARLFLLSCFILAHRTIQKISTFSFATHDSSPLRNIGASSVTS